MAARIADKLRSISTLVSWRQCEISNASAIYAAMWIEMCHRTNAACLAEPDDALNWLALESCACPLPSAANASRVSGSGVVSPLAIVIKN